MEVVGLMDMEVEDRVADVVVAVLEDGVVMDVEVREERMVAMVIKEEVT